MSNLCMLNAVKDCVKDLFGHFVRKLHIDQSASSVPYTQQLPTKQGVGYSCFL